MNHDQAEQLHESMMKLSHDKAVELPYFQQLRVVLPREHLRGIESWLRVKLHYFGAVPNTYRIIHEGIRYDAVPGAVARAEVLDHSGQVLEEMALPHLHIARAGSRLGKTLATLQPGEPIANLEGVANIRVPSQMVGGIVRHRENTPAFVLLHSEEPVAVPIKANSCYAWVSEDAEIQELRLLLEQVLKVLASKELET